MEPCDAMPETLQPQSPVVCPSKVLPEQGHWTGQKRLEPTSSTQQPLNHRRKEKSLGELCAKFIQLFEGTLGTATRMITGTIFSLDLSATALQVSRRRVYDIVNILGALRAVTREAKNVYQWRGLESVDYFLWHLEVLAECETSC